MEEAEAVIEEARTEAPAPVEPTVVEEAEAVVVEVLTEPDTASDDDDSFGFGPKYDYSFEARLALAEEEDKIYHSEIAAFARAYGVKVSRSWARERIYLGKNLFAIITFKARKLALAFAKDPATADAKYHAQDMSEFKKFERTPMLMRISSRRKVKFATDLLRELFTEAGLTDKKLKVTPEVADHRTREELLSAGLIRPKSK